MLQGWTVVAVSLAYLGILFAIAAYGDRRADQGRSIITSPYVYTLSIAIYCTAWTFYGSVGLASQAGLAFLPVYLGPTLMACLWWLVLRKMLRITKAYRITSIADFVASRYGKASLLGGVVTVIAMVGYVPYIALQLKAISASVTVVVGDPGGAALAEAASPFGLDTALVVALFLAAFSILFGTRHIDATEHHQGMVAAVAFESVVKLIAFLAVGVFVTYGVYGGFGDLVARAREADLGHLLSFEATGYSYGDWLILTVLSGLAVVFLPRMFQVAVIENIDEDHLRKAIWLFPLYLFAINLFVLPIALAGRMHFPDGAVDADTFVLTLPMVEDAPWLALLVYVGGLSAATAMVIVASVAVSTMMCNDLVMPVLLRLRWLRLQERSDLTGLLLAIRRGSILAILLMGYLYVRVVGEAYSLVAIGLVSFAAAAQFAPPILLGIFWKGATRKGALAGLVAGFAVWVYTLLLPALARAGWIGTGFLLEGPGGITLLRPESLFGLAGLQPISHGVLWSLATNLLMLLLVSLLDRQGTLERIQASLFVDVFRREGQARLWRGSAHVVDLQALLARFLGPERADLAFEAHGRGVAPEVGAEADPDLVERAERMLAAAIGAASARVMVASVVKGEVLGPGEVMEILDEASQVRAYSHRLEQKSRELEAATLELKQANDRLTELDRLKDDFISTVSHELRTPLTSIRSFSEILLDTPDLDREERDRFLGIVVRESERLTRLINDILDMSRIESGRMEWHLGPCDLRQVVEEALAATSGLFHDRRITVEAVLALGLPPLEADRDRLIQVMINLLSNAAKFAPAGEGKVSVRLERQGGALVVSVADNGPGIPAAYRERVFEKFHQVSSRALGKPTGSGLGLTISRHIVERFGGRIRAEAAEGGGALFRFTLPIAGAAAAAAK